MAYIDDNIIRLSKISRFLKLHFPDYENDFEDNHMLKLFSKKLKIINFYIKPEYTFRYKYKLPIIEVNGNVLKCSLKDENLDICISTNYDSLFEIVYSDEYDDHGEKTIEKMVFKPFKFLHQAKNLDTFINVAINNKELIENYPHCFPDFIKDILLFK